MSLKFQNGLEVDECTECWGSGGWDDEDGDWETCDCCGGTGYDSIDYRCYMEEQADLEDQTRKTQTKSQQTIEGYKQLYGKGDK